MLSKLCFKPLTNKTFSMYLEGVIPMLPIPMIFPLPLSPKVTIPPSLASSVMNCDSSPVMCLEHPLSRYHFLFPSWDARHTCKHRSSFCLRYPSFLGSFQVSQNGSFWNPYFLCVCIFVNKTCV